MERLSPHPGSHRASHECEPTLPLQGRVKKVMPRFNFQRASNTHLLDPATRYARVVARTLSLRKKRAQGMPGARCARRRVCDGRTQKAHSVSQVTPESSGIPRAMVLTASFVLFPATGFVATVIPEKLASQELDASIGASEPHDFSVRLTRRSLSALPRPPHPDPRP